MKKIIFSFLALSFTLAVNAKDMQELIVTTNPPMSCQNCENKIKGNLRFEKGVKKIETNIPDQRVTIEYDADKTTPEQIENAFNKIGYQVRVIEDTENQNSTPAACKETTSSSSCGNCPSNSCTKQE